ncbi:MAG: type VI secretion system amidase effector protein Tae4 [Burkholderiaceae bacterium]|nr:type VI secretion system amidase effector protein Tae4 [Burkholderiaceae bacterium]
MMRPHFTDAWAAAMRIFDPNGSTQAKKVAQIVGGKVAMNILPEGRPGKWENTCSVRMSYILNQTNVIIPFAAGKTVSGADGRWYFHYIRDVIAFLKRRWGPPDEVIPYPRRSSLTGKTGVVLFEVSGWADATGHATVWNGESCYDHCYFYDPDAAYTTTRASFWALK